jgi:hypothetical protein
MRSKDWFRNLGVKLYNRTVGWLYASPVALYETTMPPNPPRIMDSLMRIHGTCASSCHVKTRVPLRARMFPSRTIRSSVVIRLVYPHLYIVPASFAQGISVENNITVSAQKV